MRSITVKAGDRRRRVEALVKSLVELECVIKRVLASYPNEHVIVSFYNEAGDELAIGLGPQFGTASFTPVSGHFVSHVMASAIPFIEANEIAFAWYDDYAYVEPGGLIPPDTAREIAKKWFAKGILDPSVQWWTQPA